MHKTIILLMIDYTTHPSIQNDAILSDWMNGRPVGGVYLQGHTQFAWVVSYNNKYLERISILAHESKQAAYLFACERQLFYSNAIGKTRNQYRWRQDANGVKYGELRLNHGKTMLFDESDLDLVTSHCWGALAAKSNLWYARNMGIGLFHIAKMNVSFLDHINHDPLDNRAANLRPSNPVLNQRNRRMHSKNKSGITGLSRVTRHRKGRLPEVNWVVHWGDNLKNFTRTFSCRKYGETLAKQLAIKKRKEVEERLGFTCD